MYYVEYDVQYKGPTVNPRVFQSVMGEGVWCTYSSGSMYLGSLHLYVIHEIRYYVAMKINLMGCPNSVAPL